MAVPVQDILHQKQRRYCKLRLTRGSGNWGMSQVCDRMISGSCDNVSLAEDCL